MGLAYTSSLQAGEEIAAGLLEPVLESFAPARDSLFIYFPCIEPEPAEAARFRESLCAHRAVGVVATEVAQPERSSMRPVKSLSAAAARGIALAAQGFATARSGCRESRPGAAQIEKVGLVQIDSVSAVVRSHYLPLFSRLGPYPTAQLDQLAYGGRRRRLFEYWGHEASLLPVASQPLLRWRMARAAQGQGIYSGSPGSAASGAAISRMCWPRCASGVRSAPRKCLRWWCRYRRSWCRGY